MFKITCEPLGLPDVKSWLDYQKDEAIPKAIVKGLNNTAYKARLAVIEEMKRVFDRPTPWALRRVYYDKATRERLYARVYMAEDRLEDKAPGFMLPLEGGPRGQKPWERLLARKGIIGNNQVLMPRQGVELNQYGNASSGLIRGVLSGLQAGSDASQDSPLKGQGYRGTRAGRKVVRRFDTTKNREGVVTIWQWQGGDFTPLFTTVIRTRYKKRLRLNDVVNEVVDKILWDEFMAALTEEKG